jgi:hypothetical protein
VQTELCDRAVPIATAWAMGGRLSTNVGTCGHSSGRALLEVAEEDDPFASMRPSAAFSNSSANWK